MKIFIFEDDLKRIEFFKKLMKLFKCDDYTITDDYRLTISKLSKNKYDVVFLDHDIAGQYYTGYDIAKFIVDNKITATQIIIHSMNPIGAERMLRVLGNNASIVPFDKLLITYKKELNL